ncbi:hypothetical protein UPYG_G00348170 [Umbra pygmaea]|uniref:Uncharacterized protein n=1 Tax=Umbra pygmaea TaxID=75934 RepID=A0ABD0WFH7_UMBPY
MPSNEVKQRKKATTQKHDEPVERSNTFLEEAKKSKATEGYFLTESKSSSPSFLDLKTITSLLSLVVCLALTLVVFQQNAKFSDVDEKYKLLARKTSGLLEIEEEVIKVSNKLSASEDDLQSALSTASLASRLEREIYSLQAIVKAMQDDENSASHDLQNVNARFMNVTELWQTGLESLTSDLASLKMESREAHASATDRVNEAERRAQALDERLEELEVSTRRNTRALGHTEDGDAKQAQDQLDWNTKQLHKLEDQVHSLLRVDTDLIAQLQEHIPRAQECEAHLPAVEEAVRSILRLAGDLTAAERRLEELTLQVFRTEDNMLKAMTEVLNIRQALDALQAHNTILKMTNELAIVKETLGPLKRREVEQDNLWISGKQEEEGECNSVHSLLERLQDPPGAFLPQLETMEWDVSQLKDWASGLTEKGGKLHENLASLKEALGKIEGRTSAINADINNKLASVRTDVRRMGGLQSDVGSLLAKVGALEERATQAERSMIKRIGDLLASSIDRFQGLKAASERIAQGLEQLKRRLPELYTADRQLSERLRELESGRARLVRTVTFAGDLKPKVATIKRDFGALVPQVNDLTLRIGRLAEDLTNREKDIAEFQQMFANMSAVQEDLRLVSLQLSRVVPPLMPEVGGEMLGQKVNVGETLPQTLEGEL